MYLFHYIPTVYKCMYNAVFYPGMTGTNEYAFIIIPTNYFPLYYWKADPTKSELYWDIKQRDRDEDAKKAFQVKNIYIRTATVLSLFYGLNNDYVYHQVKCLNATSALFKAMNVNTYCKKQIQGLIFRFLLLISV